MRAAQVVPSVHVASPQLEISVRDVATSSDLESEDFSKHSRLAVVLDVLARTDYQLDPSAARIVIGDDRSRKPIATGRGDAPRLLQEQLSAPISLHAGERARVWVAFGGVPAQDGPEHVEPIEVSLPDQPALRLSAADAGPRWQSDQPWRSSGLTYFELMYNPDGGHANLVMLDLRWAFDRWILSSAWGPGGRRTPSNDASCCHVGMRTRLMRALVVTNPFVLSVGAGLESAIWLGKPQPGRPDYSFGASLGVELGFARIYPERGPFPLYTSSPLAEHNIYIGAVQWFGDDRGSPSIGLGLGYTRSTGY